MHQDSNGHDLIHQSIANNIYRNHLREMHYYGNTNSSRRLKPSEEICRKSRLMKIPYPSELDKFEKQKRKIPDKI